MRGMSGGDCGERNEWSGLWGKGSRERVAVEKGLREGDCGERDEGRRLWGKGSRKETVGKGMQGEG